MSLSRDDEHDLLGNKPLHTMIIDYIYGRQMFSPKSEYVITDQIGDLYYYAQLYCHHSDYVTLSSNSNGDSNLSSFSIIQAHANECCTFSTSLTYLRVF